MGRMTIMVPGNRIFSGETIDPRCCFPYKLFFSNQFLLIINSFLMSRSRWLADGGRDLEQDIFLAETASWQTVSIPLISINQTFCFQLIRFNQEFPQTNISETNCFSKMVSRKRRPLGVELFQ